jgi:phosphoserine phosphatase
MDDTMTSAEIWVRFAATAITRPGISSIVAAQVADNLLREFHKRYSWYSGGYGHYWEERSNKKEESYDTRNTRKGATGDYEGTS